MNNDFSVVPCLFDKSENSKENNDHEDRYDGNGQYLIVKSDAAEFSVIGYFFFVVFKSPDFSDKYTYQNTADRHQEICGEGVQPVIDSQHSQAVSVQPWKFYIA